MSGILSQEMHFHQDLMFQMQHCLVMPVHTTLILNLGKGFLSLVVCYCILFNGFYINNHAVWGYKCIM